ncbi:hypothetical protein D3C71_698460 [compost metagenome]
MVGGGSERYAALALAHLPIGKARLFLIEAQLAGDGLAQAHAGRVHAGRGTVAAPLPARTGRDGKIRIAEAHDHLVQGHAQHFRRRLRDDGVTARADVRHVRFHGHDAVAVQTHTGGGLHDEVVAEGGRHAHAYEPAAVAPHARLRRSFLPAEFHGARAQAVDQAALGKRPTWFFRVHFRVVQDAENDGVHFQLVRHLVHRDFQRHHARRLARRAHGVAFRQVEHGQAHGRHAVRSRIQQPRLHHGRFRLPPFQVAGPRFMADGRDLAVARGADAQALDGGGPVRRVVDHQGPRQGDLDGTPGRARAQRRQQGFRAHEQLAAETAADIRRNDTHLVFRYPQSARQIAAAPVHHLVRRPHRHLVAFPGGNRGVRLHHRVRLVGCRVHGVQAHGGMAIGAGEVARLAVGLAIFRLGGAALGLGQVEHTRLLDILDVKQLCGRAGLLEGFRHHQRDGLVVMFNVRPAQQLRRVHLAFAQLASRLGRDHGQHARCAPRGARVDRRDAPLGDGRADDMAVGRMRRGLVLFICIRRRARGFQGAVDAVRGAAHDFQLVDGIGGRRCRKFHGPSLSSLVLAPAPRQSCAAPGSP